MPNILTRAAIRASDDLPRTLLEIPEWGGAVYFRPLTAAERDRYEASLVVAAGKPLKLEGARARLVVAAASDADGARLFEDGDVAWLAEKNAAAVDRICTAILTASGMAKGDGEAAKGN